MIVGDPTLFALESSISTAYERLSFRALGFFLIHIRSVEFGVRSDTATLLACSFDNVAARIRNAGTHRAPFSNLDANVLADALTSAIYAPDDDQRILGGLSNEKLLKAINDSNIIWAPDGDQAFDDGTLVAQFDVDNRVRLIGFRRENCRAMRSTLQDVWLEAREFYSILKEWHSAFDAEWAISLKKSNSSS